MSALVASLAPAQTVLGMANRTNFDDCDLWLALAAAKEDCDEVKTAQVRSQIVETHLGFFVSYAHDTAFKSWSESEVQGYLHEIILVVMSLVDRFDPERGVKFISFCRPYLRPIAWKVQAMRGTVWNGYETERLRALIRRRQSEAMGRGEVLSIEDLADQLAVVHGKRITVGRVRRIIESPAVISGDSMVNIGGEEGPTIFDKLTDDSDPTERIEREEKIEAVRTVLASLTLGQLEVAIVTKVLMASPYREHTFTENGRQIRVVMDAGPASDRSLAEQFGLTVGEVVERRERLMEMLRHLLSC